MRCAIVETATNTVTNIAIADPAWSPGEGLYLVPLNEGEECLIGQVYDVNGSPRFSGTPTPVVKTYTSYQFLLRFTAEERAAFRAAAITDTIVADFQELATAAHEISTDNPTTLAGMNYLVSAGLITEQRKQEVLG
jgi:hypothetical protein